MLKINVLDLTANQWKVSFNERFQQAGILGFGNSGFSIRQPGDGAETSTHSHPDAEEIYITMGGKAVATVDGQRIPLEFGDLLIVQPGEQHKIEAAPDSGHQNLWMEPDKIRFLTPLPNGQQVLNRNVSGTGQASPDGMGQVVVSGEETPAASIAVYDGTRTSPHAHHRCIEYLHILEGSGEVQVGDVEVPVVPGSLVVVPAGVRHSISGGLKALSTNVPALEVDDTNPA